MSASQQATNRRLHKIIDQIEDQLAKSQDREQQAVDEANYYRRGFNSAEKELESLKEERNEFKQSAVDALGRVEDLQDMIHQLEAEKSRLRNLIPEAWTAGRRRLSSTIYMTEQPDLHEWMKQKGLA